MKFLYTLPFLATASVTNYHVPVTSDRYGHAIVEVDNVGETPPHHSLIVSLNSLMEFYDDFHRTRHWNITLSNTNISLVPISYSVRFHSREVRLGELGISQRGDWVRRYQSLAVIKNATDPTHLVVGITPEYFSSVCIEGSLIRVDHSQNRGLVEFSAVYNPEGLLRLTDIHISSYFYESPLYLSTSLAERVGARLMATGAIPDGPNSFVNCTHLPQDLALTLVIASGQTSIRLFPDDFIQHNPLVNTCSFYLTSSSGMYRSSAVVFNPLLVSGMNVRTSAHHFVEICDTSL